ncbi:hypothetical protein PYCCODRAFT_400579 [Trametes coccinea BRFM310]|uniref:Fungal-type protein kinase domain-containing protein n=1 Tax=Trametes coccinea (strain BRFM310) TaxID=1353009 RepID=A0A1Y2IMR2_TRAC3|nr:hypothetical protein PYCCODRAFT_400579 [Trametes coccinea BRFM310]
MSPTRGAYNVPMALDPELSHTYGLHPGLAEPRLKRHIADCKKCTLGPMPADMFLKELLPLSSSDTRGRLSSRSAFNGVPQRADSPTRIYVPLLHALNKRTKTKSRCPGFEFVDTHERSRKPTHPGYAKPHICCFTPDNASIIRDASPHARLEFAYAELFIQVASDPAADFFVDPPPEVTEDAPEAVDNPPEHTKSPVEAIETHPKAAEGALEVTEGALEVTEDAPAATEGGTAHDFAREIEDEDIREAAERTYGLHIAYATEILARQHRLFLFSISLHGSFARFFRWDRAGCLVSEAFDIRRQPHLLTDFLWRFSQLPDAKRGLDTTVRLASPHEEAMFRDAIRDEVRLQLEIEGDELEKAVSAHYLRGHVAVIPVTPRRPLTSDEREHRFIVSRPIVSPLTLPGRGTRGFWAVDADTGRVVFLKDCWRFYWAEQIEGDILHGLNELGVRNVPLLAVHGDVPVVPSAGERASDPVFQSSLTEAYLGDPWICQVDGVRVRVNELWHYRLATFTVGYSLKSLRGTEELLYATHDALTAMRDALEKDSRIHRDLSVGNIVLVKEPDRAVRKGYLIDWEASDRIDDAGEALHRGRAGTWMFMSIRMLNSDQVNGKHTFADDMEALFYVVLYCALHYLPHDLSPEDLTSLTEGFFDQRLRRVGGVMHGGSGKIANAHARFYTEMVHFHDAAFNEWLQTVMDFHCQPLDAIKRRENLWTLDNLDAYWTQFLETHDLECGNRQVHKPFVDAVMDSCSSSPSSSSTEGAIVTKRRVDELKLKSNEQRGPKVARLQADASRQPPMASRRSADERDKLAAPAALRRSERIRSQRSSRAQSEGLPNAIARTASNEHRGSQHANSKKGRAKAPSRK